MEDRKLTAEDKKWMARSDAQTLMAAEGVKADSARLKRAAVEAHRIANEAEKAARMSSSAASKIAPKPQPKPQAQAPKPQAKRGK